VFEHHLGCVVLVELPVNRPARSNPSNSFLI
jgi:hypothetical protein